MRAARRDKKGHQLLALASSTKARIFYALTAIYLLVFIGGALLQRDLLFQNGEENMLPAQTAVPEMREALLRSSDGTQLITWVSAAANEDAPLVVYFHGNAGVISDRAHRFRWFLDQGYSVVGLAYRGSAGSVGQPSEATLTMDAHALYAALPRLLGREIKPSQILLYGESLGTGIAVALAAQRSVGGVVLESPYTSIEDVVQAMLPIYPIKASGVIQDKFDSLEHIAEINAPLLILHGSKDSLINVAQGQALMDRAQDPKWARWFGEGDHNNLWQVGAQDEISTFVGRYFVTSNPA